MKKDNEFIDAEEIIGAFKYLLRLSDEENDELTRYAKGTLVTYARATGEEESERREPVKELFEKLFGALQVEMAIRKIKMQQTLVLINKIYDSQGAEKNKSSDFKRVVNQINEKIGELHDVEQSLLTLDELELNANYIRYVHLLNESAEVCYNAVIEMVTNNKEYVVHRKMEELYVEAEKADKKVLTEAELVGEHAISAVFEVIGKMKNARDSRSTNNEDATNFLNAVARVPRSVLWNDFRKEVYERIDERRLELQNNIAYSERDSEQKRMISDARANLSERQKELMDTYVPKFLDKQAAFTGGEEKKIDKKYTPDASMLSAEAWDSLLNEVGADTGGEEQKIDKKYTDEVWNHLLEEAGAGITVPAAELETSVPENGLGEGTSPRSVAVKEQEMTSTSLLAEKTSGQQNRKKDTVDDETSSSRDDEAPGSSKHNP